MRLIVIGLMLAFSSITHAASVATVSPITHSMSTALLKDTTIDVVYVPPTRLPINRIPSWLNRNSTQPTAHFDAFVTIKSMRPKLDFYTSLRSSNIRVVPIDIAQALLPGGEQVALSEPTEYFWLNINNALLMLGILQRDLSAMWPNEAESIEKNYQNTSAQLRTLVLATDETLITSGYDALVTNNKNLLPFSKSLMLPTLTLEEAAGLTAIELSTSDETHGKLMILVALATPHS